MVRPMKNRILFLTILMMNFCLTLKAQINDSLTLQIFENKTFNAREIIGLKDFKYEPQISIIELAQSDDVYGNITTFKNGKFTSGNIGPCGNECRVTVSGTYSFTGNKIYLFLETIFFWKECSHEPIQTINKEIGTFNWEQEEDGTVKLSLVN
jgi:hypothetical protein